MAAVETVNDAPPVDGSCGRRTETPRVAGTPAVEDAVLAGFAAETRCGDRVRETACRAVDFDAEGAVRSGPVGSGAADASAQPHRIAAPIPNATAAPPSRIISVGRSSHLPPRRRI